MASRQMFLGDADGVIIVAEIEMAGSAIDAAEQIAHIEGTMTQAIRAGGTRRRLFQRRPRFAQSAG